MSKQVTIIGGGIIGLCCAWYLQKNRHEVRVIDKGDITDGTSFGNAGYVSPSHFTPLATPGIVAQGLRWMLSSTSPFYIKPRFSWELVRWLFSFWKQANAQTVAKHIPPLNNLLHLSRELTTGIKNELGNPFGMEEKGCLMMYRTPSVEKHEIELAEQAAQLNIATRILNAQQVQNLEPDVTVDVKGAVLYPIDCHLHPGDLMRTLKTHLEKAGVHMQLHTTVIGFEKQNNRVTAVLSDKGKFECGELVLASGSWLPVLARKLGVNILLQAGKGYSMTYENVPRNIKYPAILVDKRTAMTPLGNDLRMGGTMEISGLDSPILIKRAQAIFKAAKLYYPDLPVAFLPKEKIWSGLRPLTPDGLPYIGRHNRYNNLIIAGGHAMLGVSLAAGTGKLVEEMVSGKKTTIETEAFDPGRF